MEEGGRNGLSAYDEGNSGSIGKGIIVEIGGRSGRLDYAKALRDKPKWSPPDEGNIATIYTDSLPRAP